MKPTEPFAKVSLVDYAPGGNHGVSHARITRVHVYFPVRTYIPFNECKPLIKSETEIVVKAIRLDDRKIRKISKGKDGHHHFNIPVDGRFNIKQGYYLIEYGDEQITLTYYNNETQQDQ